MKPAQPNQSLIDGLACLQALSAHAEPIGSRELARMLSMEPTRVNRLLKTLAFVGLAQQNDRSKYLPGPGLHVLAAQSVRGSGLLRRALDPLESLFDLDLQVALGVLWSDKVCYLYHWSPGDRPGSGLGREPLYPAAMSGLGQALLAKRSDEEVRAIYDEVAKHPVAGATRSHDVVLDGSTGLLRELAEVRERGYALTTTEEISGYRTLAITLTRDDAAIGVAGRFNSRQVPKLLRRLRAVAQEIDTADDTLPPAVWG